MNEEKKLALLIDSDNVSPKYSQFILEEASKHGNLIYKRIYGDWEKNNSGWRIPAMNNSIMPVQQNSYIAGKNATDFSMIIDAMDILYTGNVDGFVLVTSDSDFTRLAIRLRESGKLVIGIGEVKTPLAFTSSCHSFSYLDKVCANIGDYDETILRNDLINYVKENDDGKLDLPKINAYLNSRYGNIDYNALGFNRLSMFVDSIPQIVRKGTFVMTRAARKRQQSRDALDEKEILHVIVEYLNRQEGKKDNLSKVANYISKVLGKVDFSRFGSKQFAKFIDKRPIFTRDGEIVRLAEPNAAPAEAAENAAEAQPVAHTLRITSQVFVMEVKKYASESGEKGGNIGQLNNMLLEKYGKSYVADLGFADFASALASVEGVRVEKNFVSIASEQLKKRGRKPKAPVVEAPVAESKNEKTPAKKAATSKKKQPEKVEEAQEPAPKKKAGRPKKEVVAPDLNIIKRDVFVFVTQNDNAASAAAMGNMLSKKYGKNYLKELGFSTLKKLLTEIKGLTVKGDVASLNKSFIKRTEQIEQFICDFAKNDDKKSIKSLSMQLRNKFKNFDFNDYGYAKFSDFINAIDGVRANGYYVEAED
ncbi:MAG: NYN domain-containing protein [Oscillospiraceae bacterium]|nr:NYN domain-containing protein [Oscillospiraceae bacterium]